MSVGLLQRAKRCLRHVPLTSGLALMLAASVAQAQSPGWWVRMRDYTDVLHTHSVYYNFSMGDAAQGVISGPPQGIAFEGAAIRESINMNGAGTFDGDFPWPNDNTDDAVEDFFIEARADVTIPAGTWSIAFGTDDGGAIQIPGVTFESRFNADFTGFEQRDDLVPFNNVRGHAWTGGTFTLTEPLTTEVIATMHERGGGDSFEVAITQGQNSTVDATSWQLLSDGTEGWSVSTQRLPGSFIGGAYTLGTLDLDATRTAADITQAPRVAGSLVQRWFNGNQTNINTIRNEVLTGTPVVGPFSLDAADTPWWTGDAAALTAPNVPKYPAPVPDPVGPSPAFQVNTDNSSYENYHAYLAGEIFFPANGTYLITDGVDDFTYLAIDGQELIHDNGAVGLDSVNAPIAEIEVTDAGSSGVWKSIEFAFSEGGGGDHAILYWSYDEVLNDPQGLVGFGFPTVPADPADPGVATITNQYFRQIDGQDVLNSATYQASLGAENYYVDVSADGSDQISVTSFVETPLITAADGATITTNLDVDGSTLLVNPIGSISAGSEFDLVADGVDTISGTPNWVFPGSQASDWDVSNFASSGTITALVDIGPVENRADIDGDGDVDSADLTELILGWTGSLAGNMEDGDHADLVYNPATGEVSIDPSDTESKKTVSFVLNNPAGNMTPIADSKLPIFQVAQGDNTNRQIGYTDLTLGGKEGVLELGPIFPPGMSQEQLGEFLATAKYAYALGKGGDLDLVVIPEPGALALMALGLAGLVRTVRRRRRR